MRARWPSALGAEYVLIALSAWICIEWLAKRPAAPGFAQTNDQFPVVAVALKVLRSTPQGADLVVGFFALVAVTTLLACALALVLALRSGRIPAARILAMSLSTGAASVAYVFFPRVFPELGANRMAEWRPALDFLATGLMAVSLVEGMKFFARYPFAIDLGLFVRQEMSGARISALEERLPWLFRNVLRRGDVESVEERRTREEAFFRKAAQPWAQRATILAFATLGALAMTVGDPWWLALGSIGTLAALYVFWFAFACMRYKYKRALDETKPKIEWLYLGAWANGLLLLLWSVAAAFTPLLPYGTLSMLPFITFASFAPVVVGLIGLLTLAVSVFYRGTVDPNLAIRRTTVSALFIALLAGLFVLAERSLAAFAATRLGLGPDTNAIVAGALAGVMFLPLRRFAEAGARRLVERLTPVATLGDGPRHSAAVVFSDLSGYTALSARDERSAIVAAALFHREAKKIAEREGGRLVKTIGDAVHLEFPGAREAITAARQLHARYPLAAAALELPALGIHSGVHVGEVIATPDGDIYGTVVNVAARLQGQARDGEIVVSQAVREACVECEFSDLGTMALKNLPEKLHLFAITP